MTSLIRIFILTIFASLFFSRAEADACRLHTPVLAAGNGHNAACLIAQDGRVSIVEYGLYDSEDFNKDGSNALIRFVRGTPVKVKINDKGHLDESEMAKIVAAFADYYGLDSINVSFFANTIDYDAGIAEIAKIENEIQNGVKYELFSQNCTHIATRILRAAGLTNLKNGPNPNEVIRLEIKKITSKFKDPYNWTGKWMRTPENNWVFERAK